MRVIPGFARTALACLGAAFTAIAAWAFAGPMFSDLQTGHAVLMTVTKTRITWTHTYGRGDHPVYFFVKVLTDASGVVSFGGLGLLLLYVVARSARDPAGTRVSPRARKTGTAWAAVSLKSFLLYLLLLGFPYLLSAGILS
jgi:hypothetical protein